MVRLLCLLAIILNLGIVPRTLHAESKTYAKRGMWIGVASGAVAGGTAFAVLTANSKCQRDSDFQICGNSSGIATMTVGGAILGGLVGMGVGALVGGSVKREKSVSLAPIISLNESGAFGGFMLRKN